MMFEERPKVVSVDGPMATFSTLVSQGARINNEVAASRTLAKAEHSEAVSVASSVQTRRGGS